MCVATVIEKTIINATSVLHSLSLQLKTITDNIFLKTLIN